MDLNTAVFFDIDIQSGTTKTRIQADKRLLRMNFQMREFPIKQCLQQLTDKCFSCIWIRQHRVE